MKIFLESKKSINGFRLRCDSAEGNWRDHLLQRCVSNLTTSFNTNAVIDGNDEDTAILHDMVNRHSMDVQMEFPGTWDPKLNLTLKSAFFSEFERKFGRDFTIRGEMQLLPRRVLGTRGIVIFFKKGVKSSEDANKYFFQNNTSSYCHLFCEEYVEIMKNLYQSVVTKLILYIELNSDDMKSSHADLFQVNRKILQDEIATDVTIVASNGTQIKCHKSFLIAHSSMLEGMLNSGMQEATTNIIKMTSLSERGVRALLAYLYYWDLKEPSRHCEIAMELFKAADYYIIPRLDVDMRNLLLKKRVEWFSVDGALDLFLLCHRLNRGDQLISVALEALQMNFDELKSNADYLELLEKDPPTAVELNDAMLSMKPLKSSPVGGGAAHPNNQ